MAHVYPPRAADTSQTTGLGPIVISGVPPQANLQTFANVCNFGDQIDLGVVSRTAPEWEEGTYTYAGLGLFARTQISASSNNNQPVNFSPGIKDVFCTILARTAQRADAAAASGGGVAVLNFGAFPGTPNASTVIAGQGGILATSAVSAWVVAQPTPDHSADEHWADPPIVTAGNISGGSFTIYGSANVGRPTLLMRKGGWIYGQWNVGWSWR